MREAKKARAHGAEIDMERGQNISSAERRENVEALQGQNYAKVVGGEYSSTSTVIWELFT